MVQTPIRRILVATGLILAVYATLMLPGCGMLEPTMQEQAPSPTLDIAAPDRSGGQNDAPAATSEDRVKTAADQLSEDIKQLQQQQKQFNSELGRLHGQKSSRMTTAAASGGKGKTIGATTQPVSFNFDQADLNEVVRLFMSDILHADYVVQGDISGKVTMSIDGNFTDGQLWQIIAGILQINHVTMFEQDGRWQLMPLAQAPSALPSQNLLLSSADGVVRGQRIQAVTVKYAPVAELVKVIKPYLSKGAQVYAHEPSGTLLLCDYPTNLLKVQKLIEQFDVPPFAGMHMQVYWLQNVKADVILKELDSLAKSVRLAAGSGSNPNSSLSFVALPRLNLMLVITRDDDSLHFAEMWIKELDREVPQPLQPEPEDGIYVYEVQNGIAKDIASVLDGLFGGKSTGIQKKTKAENEPVGVKLTRLHSGIDNKGIKRNRKAPGAVSGTLSGEVTFVVDEVSNTIIIRSNYDDYQKILPMIKRLDIYPKQALIEVTIAEVLLDENNKLGIEWDYLMKDVAGTSANGWLSMESGLGLINGTGESLIGSGLSYLLINTGRFRAAIKAFSSQNRVNVLSSPHIMASDNEEASINIGDEVPIVTSEYRTTDSGSTATTTDKTIQYRDVGVILNVTPHINANGMVRMEIKQEVSQVSNKTVEGVNSPVFAKRTADTVLAVRDGQTIVIAGLMQQNSGNSYSGVPILGRMPVLKYIFGYNSKEFRNTELMIFITPHVILNEQDSTFLNRSFLNRLDKIKAELGG